MPNPNKNESEKDFIKRCIPMLIKEGKDQKQAIAICYSIYRQKGHGTKSPEPKNESFLDTYLSKVYNEATYMFGFEINVKDEATGKTEKHFIKANTVDEFIANLKKVAPELTKQSEDQIRQKLDTLKKEKEH